MVRRKVRSVADAFIVIVLVILSIFGCSRQVVSDGNNIPMKTTSVTQTPAAGQKFKVLHVMSYHTPWEWTETQLQGFKQALGDVDIEYKVFEMDTKQFSTRDQKQQKGKEARELIDTWQPDLLYTSDDDAQEYVGRYYAGASMPIVFSAVNTPPDAFGYQGAPNVTGVLEYEHIAENITLLKEIIPGVRRIAVIFDDDPMWGPTERRMREQIQQVKDVSFVSWDYIGTYETYQRRIRELQNKVDAIALIGIFTFKDEKGENVPYRTVLKWTAENSKLPDFSFWKDRVTYGTLSVVSVSGYEQGQAAGRLAREILIQGTKPGSLPIKSSMKGEPLINKARADALGIKIKSKILLSSKVVSEYGWVNTDE